MDRNKSMMEPHGDFIGRERLVFDPIASIVERRSECDGDPYRFDTNVPLGSAKLAGPSPDVTEEAPMKLREPTLIAFGAGGVFFFLIDRLIEERGGAGAQLMAMLLDFVPESMAMGALLATEKATGILLALLIALQNFPEGFNAYRELLKVGKLRPTIILSAFCALVLFGPLAAWFGFAFLRTSPDLLGIIMLFAAGGNLYLTFEDIAPQAFLDRHWAPPLGAVAGFMFGLLGHAIVA